MDNFDVREAFNMLFRLCPPTTLEWADLPGSTVAGAAEHHVDLDRADWKPTETYVFSHDLLRLALRHGVATARGLVLAAEHAVDLGRGDLIRTLQMEVNDKQDEVEHRHGQLLESVMPGWTASGEEVNRRAREASERAAEESDQELAEELAAPVQLELVQHWRQMGGALPPG